MPTIVYGLDGSTGARLGLRVAAGLADALDARLVAVHVLPSQGAPADPPGWPLRRRAHAIVSRLLEEEGLAGTVEGRGEAGDVAERLAAAAEDEGAVAIMLGARSRGRARAFLRSRLAGELAARATVPVVVVPPQSAELAAAPALRAQEAFR